MGDISIREYIRWLPDDASEPTSTIVLTTPQRRFVDIRVLKPLPSDPASADPVIPPSQLDWAIAGTSTSSSSNINGASHSQWHHWIDSRTADAESVVDEGHMLGHPSDPALTLEKGRMVNPTTGVETDYEEMWRSEPVETVPCAGGGAAEVTCLALHPETRPRRGLVVRLGQYCQAFARDGDHIALERLKWDSDQQRWVRQVRLGEQEFPTDMTTYFAHEASVGDEVTIGGRVWKVVERG
ncbi:uncharacterized protein THITE_2045531 [Thermothielavioides terrestris NRRL 8126]|uniref:Protein HRI1 n=1 Tax=Thermothielavioides terrestris (strain ATCC 38088 / NRRL 8126) TaxID=578455 RepID=G2QYS8_THETT|nr:uncharacterized protein THITE_2045531 [Thermothielavioides terrestris NRRL 8126]AEO66270.1 hypothetical protein THITE_2045531 [Thermothielavioides terrestris NRRL 8126]